MGTLWQDVRHGLRMLAEESRLYRRGHSDIDRRNWRQRTREIAIRMALGAERRGVLRMALQEGIKLTLAGAAIGLIAAFMLTRLLAGLLYGITPHDPLTFIAVVALTCLVSFAACYILARRATRVDPMVALRYE